MLSLLLNVAHQRQGASLIGSVPKNLFFTKNQHNNLSCFTARLRFSQRLVAGEGRA